ncbi:sensor histidine kinase [Desulfolithobacter sp.]
MSLFEYIKPEFWSHRERVAGKSGEQYIFRRKWQFLVAVVMPLILVPIIFATGYFYHLSRNRALMQVEEETAVLAKNASIDIELFFSQYKSTLRFIALTFGIDNLRDPGVMGRVFANLKKTCGGFLALDMFDLDGNLEACVGYEEPCKNIESMQWFDEVREQGLLIGVTTLYPEQTPLVFIGIKVYGADGTPYIIRGIFDNLVLNELLSKIRLDEIQDVFLATASGRLLSPSKYCGDPGEYACLPLEKELPAATLMENLSTYGGVTETIFVGAAPVNNTDLILGLIVPEDVVERLMATTRRLILAVLVPALLGLGVVALCLVTYVVQGLYRADMRRREYLQQVERNDKLASIGRLAAGVAHEVNNPLAIINEKAGLLKDLFTYTDTYKGDDRLLSTVDSIINAVERAGSITHRLLGFARKLEVSVAKINVEHLIRETLGFLRKEAEYKNIRINVDVPENVPDIVTDRGKLQQIILNLVNNAFAAMDDGGQLDIIVRRIPGQKAISIAVRDNGCGISEENLKLIFEPFFSTRTQSGGTGLGLAITYGLIRDLHGTLEVESKVGEGTTFTITLPFNIAKK